MDRMLPEFTSLWDYGVRAAVTELGVYSASRTIIDAFRLRHQEGDEVAIEALRRWLKRVDAVPADLLSMARHFPHAEPSLLHVLRVLS